MFTITLEKHSEDANSLLEGTDLVKKILDISREGLLHKFEGTNRLMNNGYNAFIRKMAHKIVEV